MINIAIYGMGGRAKKFIEKIRCIEWGGEVKIIAITDSFVEETKGNFENVPIYNIKEWCFIKPDCIVICAKDHEKEISKIINNISGQERKYYTPFDNELYTDILYANKIDSMSDENELFKIFKKHKHNNSIKLLHYFDVYNKWFSKYRNTDVVVCEIGVFKGGSLQIWKDYFGLNATIIGIDITEECKKYEEEQIYIEIGSQNDRDFLNYIKEKYPKIDIFIDDGSHINGHQIFTFENMFPHVTEGGIYLCEDLHTSYMENYGGGYKKEGTMIEYSKDFVDVLNSNYFDASSLNIGRCIPGICGVHFYDSMVLIEKNNIFQPVTISIENN